jgi:hypothetical protein
VASATSSIQWRLPLAFQCLPCSILALGIMFFPESPRHLMETDREDEALKVLRKLHFNGSNEEYIQREYYEIKTTIAAEKAITVPGWGIMFTVPQWRTRLMHGVAVQVFTQFTGISKLLESMITSSLMPFRCHWILPDQHVKGAGYCWTSKFARSRHLQLHGTACKYVIPSLNFIDVS